MQSQSQFAHGILHLRKIYFFVTSENVANKDKDNTLGQLVSPRLCVDRKPSPQWMDLSEREIGAVEPMFDGEHLHRSLLVEVPLVGNM